MAEVVRLAAELVRFHTDGRAESSAVAVLGPRLEAAGFRVRRSTLAEGRETLDAQLAGDGPPLVLTGHLDTVPVPDESWEHDPFGGELVDGMLHGRGSVDMKAGVAAMVVAAERIAATRRGGSAVRLLFTAGEETGCLGAETHVAAVGRGEASALLVGEPTGGGVYTGHKGVTWLRLSTTGRAAHASAPHLGDNAIVRLVAALDRLRDLDLDAHDPVLGSATSSLGTIAGGAQTNVVPSSAEATLDIRLVPGLSPEQAEAAVRALLGHEVEVRPELALPAVATDRDEPFVTLVAEAVARHGGDTQLGSASYFTDASVLGPALGGPPTVICGPGDPALAHGRDERCAIADIERAAEVYADVLSRWR